MTNEFQIPKPESQRGSNLNFGFHSSFVIRISFFRLAAIEMIRQSSSARAHGLWTYEPRQGRKAATVVCSASAVVTLAFLNSDFRMQSAEMNMALRV